jgi:hypothetical protein
MARVGIGAMLALLGRGGRVPPDAHLRQRYRLGRSVSPNFGAVAAEWPFEI